MSGHHNLTSPHYSPSILPSPWQPHPQWWHKQIRCPILRKWIHDQILTNSRRMDCSPLLWPSWPYQYITNKPYCQKYSSQTSTITSQPPPNKPRLSQNLRHQISSPQTHPTSLRQHRNAKMPTVFQSTHYHIWTPPSRPHLSPTHYMLQQRTQHGTIWPKQSHLCPHKNDHTHCRPHRIHCKWLTGPQKCS